MSDKPEQPRPTLDLVAAKARLAGSERLLEDLAQIFVDDVPPLLDRLGDMIERGDQPRASHAAHTLKSLAANFSAVPTVQLASDVESAARSGDLNEAAHLQPELRRQFRAVAEILRSDVLGKA